MAGGDLPAGFEVDQLPAGFDVDQTAPAPAATPQSSFWSTAAQIPQGINESLAGFVNLPGNTLAWLLKQAGLRDQNAPPPSETTRGALAPTFGITQPVDRIPAPGPETWANQVGRGIGDTAPALLAAPFALGGAAPSVGRSVAGVLSARPALQAGISAGSNVITNETQDQLPEWARPYYSMAVPFALGGVTHMGQRTFSAAPPPSTSEAARRELLDYGRSIGGEATAGKILGNEKLQTLESANSKLPLPFVGGRVTRTEMANRDAFQAEALRKAGDTTGATAAPPSVTQELRSKLGDKFEFLTKNNEWNLGEEFKSDIAKAQASFSDQLEAQMPRDIKAQLKEMAEAPPDAIITGRAYQNIRSKLSAMLLNAHGTDKEAIGGMIDALDNSAERALPKETMDDFRQVRQQWRNLMAITKAVGSANNPQTAIGNIPTAAYARAAKGNPDIEKLGRYGAAMVGDKVPNSGTPQRLGVTHLMGGLAGAYEGMQHAPMMTLGAIGASTLPFAFEGFMNNPAMRAGLLARYRHPSEAAVPFGALGLPPMLEQTR